jgi:hypothetical protein
MAIQDTERAVRIFKAFVSGRTAKNIESDFGISYTRARQLAGRVGRICSYQENLHIQWWKINTFKKNPVFWIKSADDYLIKWRENEKLN